MNVHCWYSSSYWLHLVLNQELDFVQGNCGRYNTFTIIIWIHIMSEQLARSAVAQSALLMLGYWQEEAFCSRLRMKGECLHVISIWVIFYPLKISRLTYLVIAVTDSVSCISPVRQELLLFEALNIYYLITNCAKLMNLRCLFTILSSNCKEM